MGRFPGKSCMGALALLLAGLTAQAQVAGLPPPRQTLQEELVAMSRQAGVIFAGQVLAVRVSSGLGAGLPTQAGATAGVIEVQFRVEQALRGCVGQTTYVMREWAGGAAANLARYRVGQRWLMLLHTPGASGLTSPVGGQDGAIPLLGSRVVEQAEAEQTADLVDLRWLEARLQRSPNKGQSLHL